MFFVMGTVPLVSNFKTEDAMNLLGKEFFPREQYTVFFDQVCQQFGQSEVVLEAKTRFFVLVKKAHYISVCANYKAYSSSQPLYPDHAPVDYRLDYSDDHTTLPPHVEWEGEVIKAKLEFKLSETIYRLTNEKTDREYFELSFKVAGDIKRLGETEITFYL